MTREDLALLVSMECEEDPRVTSYLEQAVKEDAICPPKFSSQHPDHRLNPLNFMLARDILDRYREDQSPVCNLLSLQVAVLQTIHQLQAVFDCLEMRRREMLQPRIPEDVREQTPLLRVPPPPPAPGPSVSDVQDGEG